MTDNNLTTSRPLGGFLFPIKLDLLIGLNDWMILHLKAIINKTNESGDENGKINSN